MTEKKFTWVLENFSSWDDERWDGETCYSRGFTVAGCDCRLSAYPSVYSNGDYLSLYLELAPGSSPPGWTRNVQFSFTLVNKLWPKPKSNKVSGGQCCFDAKRNIWGFSKFMSLEKLRDRRGGFLVNDRLIIIAEVKVLPATVSPMGPVRITASSLICKEGNQASDASVTKSQVAQETENASNENVVVDDDEDDDDASEESADDDDTSEEGSDDDDDDASSAASDGENDGAPKEDVGNEVSSLVTIDNATNGSSLDQVKPLEDASHTVENGDEGFNTVVASVTETSNNVLDQEIQLVKETMDVNGFEVLASQVESVRRIFERYPDIAAES